MKSDEEENAEKVAALRREIANSERIHFARINSDKNEQEKQDQQERERSIVSNLERDAPPYLYNKLNLKELGINLVSAYLKRNYEEYLDTLITKFNQDFNEFLEPERELLNSLMFRTALNETRESKEQRLLRRGLREEEKVNLEKQLEARLKERNLILNIIDATKRRINFLAGTGIIHKKDYSIVDELKETLKNQKHDSITESELNDADNLPGPILEEVPSNRGSGSLKAQEGNSQQDSDDRLVAPPEEMKEEATDKGVGEESTVQESQNLKQDGLQEGSKETLDAEAGAETSPAGKRPQNAIQETESNPESEKDYKIKAEIVIFEQLEHPNIYGIYEVDPTSPAPPLALPPPPSQGSSNPLTKQQLIEILNQLREEGDNSLQETPRNKKQEIIQDIQPENEEEIKKSFSNLFIRCLLEKIELIPDKQNSNHNSTQYLQAELTASSGQQDLSEESSAPAEINLNEKEIIECKEKISDHLASEYQKLLEKLKPTRIEGLQDDRGGDDKQSDQSSQDIVKTPDSTTRSFNISCTPTILKP